jgi:cysteine desulfurase
MSLLGKKKNIFLDYASATPVSASVLKAMKPFWKDDFANPSALYKEGVQARRAVEGARVSVADTLRVRKEEIIFTASGTESNNVAIQGVVKSFRDQVKKPHIVTTAFEHPAVLRVYEELEKQGVSITVVLPKENGLVRPEDIRDALQENTVLVSVMAVNNEIGTIQPLRKIAKIIEAVRSASGNAFPLFHSDASQAPNYVHCGPHTLGVDLLTLDGGKIYGPKGVGMLFVDRKVKLTPILFGGGQEKGIRPGTESVSLIVGFAKALSEAFHIRVKEVVRLEKLKEFFISALPEDVEVNGDIAQSVPNCINICSEGIDSEFAVLLLDVKGVSCSAQSSCEGAHEGGSHVIESIGKKGCGKSSLRFSMGRGTRKSHLQHLLKVLPEVISESRKREL